MFSEEQTMYRILKLEFLAWKSFIVWIELKQKGQPGITTTINWDDLSFKGSDLIDFEVELLEKSPS